MSNGHRHDDRGRGRDDEWTISVGPAMLMIALVGMVAIAMGKADPPDRVNRWRNPDPVEQPAPATCTDEEALEAIREAGYPNVQDFQAANGLVVDGIIGPQTKGAAC